MLVKLNLFYDSLLNVFGQFPQVAVGMLGKTVSNHKEDYFMPSRRSISLAEITPDLRDSSISFQNSGEEYSKLSNNSSKASTKRFKASFGAMVTGFVSTLVDISNFIIAKIKEVSTALYWLLLFSACGIINKKDIYRNPIGQHEIYGATIY